MKISTWSIMGYLTGTIFILLSAIRYFVVYPDMDKAIAYVVIGILIMAVSWLYNSQLNNSNKITAIEDYLAVRKQ
jgi:uncharacterized membrane protein